MVKFVDVSARDIEQQMIRDFERQLGVTLYPGDERRIFLEQLSQVVVGLKGDINHTGTQNMWRYATGTTLDALAELVGVTRLPAQPARVSLRFTLSEARPTAVTIPKGTRVTPDGALYFATTQVLTIASGQLTGDVVSQATVAGAGYNGFTPGQIATIVDPVAFVASVQNIDTSSGGTDVESDDALRERGRLAPASFSTAGPAKAYEYWAKSADSTIADVAIDSPSPGAVDIYVLLAGGQIPTQDVLDKVSAVVNDRYRRPLTDNVTVLVPTTVSYDISLTYYISQERVTEEAAIRAAVEEAVTEYTKWQSARLGRAINPDYLRQLMLNAGASRITLTSPAYTLVDGNSVAIANAPTVAYGGLE